MNISKKTKVICTIGPSTDSYEKIKGLADNGMNVARLNFSHGNHIQHQRRIDIIKQLNYEGYNIGILLDTKGPEIRVLPMVNNGVNLIEGNNLIISMNKVELGNDKIISTTYPNLINMVKVGTIIKVDDGKLNFKVVEIDRKNNWIVTEIMNSGILKSNKSVGIPFTKLDLPFISQRDYEDLLFACENKVDYIAASFTRSKQDILDMREVLNANGGGEIQILAKIENYEGVENIDEILEVVDGVMVARGDLGIELSFEDVPVIQRELVHKCRAKSKIIIVATQMLESMIESPAPTRAEVGDVANAVYHGVDAIMLSGETASGKYPLEACEMEARISKRIEADCDYKQFAENSYKNSIKDSNDSIAYSVVSTAMLTKSKLIVCFSKTGNTARRVSYYRPECPIISVSDDLMVRTKLALNYGVYPVFKNNYEITLTDFERVALEIANELNIEKGSNILLTGGDRIGNTNFMKIIKL